MTMKTRLLRLLAVIVYGAVTIGLTPVWLRHYDALPIIPKQAFQVMLGLMGGATPEDVADAEAATIWIAIVVLTAPVVLLVWWLSSRRG